MARNGSGTMSLTETFTANTPALAEDVTNVLSDIADEITNSVAKDGQTTITNPLKGYAGTVSAPGYAFSGDTDCGMYSIGANNIGLAVNGTKILDIATTGLSIVGTMTPSGQIVAAAGTVSAPGIAFTGELDCGFYKIGTANVGFAIDGTKLLDLGAAAVAVTGTLAVSGATTLSSTLAAGNTTITGTLAASGNVAINTNKFTVTATSGDTLVAGTLAVTGASTLTGALTVSSTSGIAARNSAKAYAMFTQSGTTVSYTASTQGFNIATITRTDVGVYTVAFTSALPTANFAVSIMSRRSNNLPLGGYVTSKATSGFTLTLFDIDGDAGAAEPDACDFIVFGY